MRDLRSNIRDLSEPIIIKNFTEEVYDGVVEISQISDDFTVYGNVMLAKNKASNNTSGTRVDNTAISVKIRRNIGKDITIDATQLVIRGNTYIVRSVDSFGINQEYQTLECVLKND